MSHALPIALARVVAGAIRPPGSKSLTNRALVCAALAEGDSELRGALDSEDTRVMIDALRALGLRVEHDAPAGRVAVAGGGGSWPAAAAELFVGNSGTTMRFLAAMLVVGQGRYHLDGVPRMRQRPIGDLLDALRALGADIVSEAGNGCPPVLARAAGLPGGAADIKGDVSSQFLSGLLLAAPYARRDVELRVAGALVSQPYVAMTLGVMRAFGVNVAAPDARRLTVASGQRYQGRVYDIEPDASAASYFWAAAAITGGEVAVLGLNRDALQGDVAFCECLAAMGCQVRWEADRVVARGPQAAGGALRGVEVDMNAISDTAPTLAVTALFAQGPTTIRGIEHARHKETDRVADVARELRKLGAAVEEFADGLRVTPPAGGVDALRGAEIATYQDHRMAMSFALAGLRVPGVVILDPACTAKTYPNFFADLDKLRG